MAYKPIGLIILLLLDGIILYIGRIFKYFHYKSAFNQYIIKYIYTIVITISIRTQVLFCVFYRYHDIVWKRSGLFNI